MAVGFLSGRSHYMSENDRDPLQNPEEWECTGVGTEEFPSPWAGVFITLTLAIISLSLLLWGKFVVVASIGVLCAFYYSAMGAFYGYRNIGTRSAHLLIVLCIIGLLIFKFTNM